MRKIVMQDPLTLYKLIILYMLNRVDFPMTKAQISDFLLERDYTNFLTLQQAIGELIDAAMIKAESIRNRTHLALTPDGAATLSYFGNRIGEGIREDIDEYLNQNKMELRNEVSILSDYYKSTTGEFEVHLRAKEKGIPLIDLTLSVPLEETAASICENWQRKNQDIYQYLMKTLF